MFWGVLFFLRGLFWFLGTFLGRFFGLPGALGGFSWPFWEGFGLLEVFGTFSELYLGLG